MSDPRDSWQGDVEPQPVPRRSAESAPSVPTAASAASATDPLEVSGTPVGTPEPSGSWRKVTKAPAAVDDNSPLADAGLPDAPPPMPPWVKWTGIVAVAVLLLLALWLGLSLGDPAPVETESPSPTPTVEAWPLEAPQVVGDMVRGDTSESEDPAIPGRIIISADYSNGTDRIALSLSRPEDDLRKYLSNAGITQVSEVGEASCGTYTDIDSAACVRIADETAITVVGLTEQAPKELATHVDEFYEALSS